jgi:hypothetical protein
VKSESRGRNNREAAALLLELPQIIQPETEAGACAGGVRLEQHQAIRVLRLASLAVRRR